MSDAGSISRDRPLTGAIRPGGPPLSLEEYERTGGYRAARRALAELQPADVIAAVTAARLRGRGGAGFPTGQKWSFVPSPEHARQPIYLIANADEMEPGTFKDRYLLESNPHLLIEGMILAAYAVGASSGYVFIRGEYTRSIAAVRAAIVEAEQAGYLGRATFGSSFDLELRVHRSAGRYMCGEETGLINSLEGRRAYPRSKPPFPPVVGLWSKPTIVQNVETLCCVPGIVAHGPEWFRGLARSEDGGTKLYGVSGRVNSPGLWELPLGTPLREILEQHAGSMQPGYRFRAALPGGASTDFITEEHLDLPLDFTGLAPAQSRVGTGTAIILDDRTCPVGATLNLARFFAQESCGWCTPCREGLPWVVNILQALEEGTGRADDIEILEHHVRFLSAGFTFCALAPGAVEPLQSAIRIFRRDFEEHVHSRGCPYRRAGGGVG